MNTKAQNSGEHIKQLSNFQKVIFSTMSKSKGNIPHFYVSIEVNFTRLIKIRQQIKEKLIEKITYTPLLLKAVAEILKKYPMLNAHVLEDCRVKLHDNINIGVAVSTERGLIVLVIKEVNNKTLGNIVSELNELKKRAHATRLSISIEDIKEGTFTLSNIGMYGVSQMISVIKPPESAILSVGAIINKPVAESNEVKIRPMTVLTMSADHRVTDGVMVAGFLNSLKSLLESENDLLKIYGLNID